MSTPFLGEIKIVSFLFAPKGWAMCNGQLLPINQNQALFALLGTSYGGDGRVTFALPDFRGRAPVHTGTIIVGQRGGEEQHTLTIAEMPLHNHSVPSSSVRSNQDDPTNATWAADESVNRYSTGAPTGQLDAQAVSAVGGGQPHSNMQPYLVLNYIIALIGIFPSQN